LSRPVDVTRGIWSVSAHAKKIGLLCTDFTQKSDHISLHYKPTSVRLGASVIVKFTPQDQ